MHSASIAAAAAAGCLAEPAGHPVRPDDATLTPTHRLHHRPGSQPRERGGGHQALAGLASRPVPAAAAAAATLSMSSTCRQAHGWSVVDGWRLHCWWLPAMVMVGCMRRGGANTPRPEPRASTGGGGGGNRHACLRTHARRHTTSACGRPQPPGSPAACACARVRPPPRSPASGGQRRWSRSSGRQAGASVQAVGCAGGPLVQTMRWWPGGTFP